MKTLFLLLVLFSGFANAAGWPMVPFVPPVPVSQGGTGTTTSTGTGSTVLNQSPTLVTPVLGAASATTLASTAATGTAPFTVSSSTPVSGLGTTLITSAGQPCVAITVGASPFAYTATNGGDVTVGGGVVTAMTKTRATVVVWNTTLANDDIPVRAGDIITVTYTTVPVMYQCSN